jgi:D-serine deaminase-like pyridoxal phosphate-dependent protein
MACSLDAATHVSELRTPALAVIRSILERNTSTMLARAEKLGCQLRPHVKTTKTIEGATLQTGGTKRHITVSTLAEANFFADGGFDDIIYAVPLTADKVADVLRLSARLECFHVMLDSMDGFRAVEDAVRKQAADASLSVVIGIDCGYGRDGADADAPETLALAQAVGASAHATVAGIYTHAGHSYGAADRAALDQIGVQERDTMVRAAATLRAAGVTVPMVGVGSTPSCSCPPPHLDGVDEMHPGNYAYYDTMQLAVGACAAADIAVRVLTRVVGHYPKRNMLLVDLGWTGVSAQGAEVGYGAFLESPQLRMLQLKQECGEVGSADGTPVDFAKHPIGSLLHFAPYHACAATQQHTQVHVLADDRATVLASWRICKGW